MAYIITDNRQIIKIKSGWTENILISTVPCDSCGKWMEPLTDDIFNTKGVEVYCSKCAKKHKIKKH